MKILLTGGCGFIGSTLIPYFINEIGDEVINIDLLTYAGNRESLKSVADSKLYNFEHVDICNRLELDRIFEQYRPDMVMHLAAESHVDRSIDGPDQFIQTNIVGTYTLLEAARKYLKNLSGERAKNFRFHHVSTDEVYGDLADTTNLFTEKTAYDPRSPYSASKASSDHLVRAWSRTYNLPVVISNCSNNYGPYQFPEKLIPLIILNGISGVDLPIYGKGDQIRDWLYVEDHVRALVKVLKEGRNGETYNIGGYNEISNDSVVRQICSVLDELIPSHIDGVKKYEDLIVYVRDRPGHDFRYAIDASKIENELGWKPHETFSTGMRKTVQWYLDNENWWKNLLNGSYQRQRLGLLD